MKITAIAATTNDHSFTEEGLEMLAKSSVGVPITINFDRKKIVGKVEKATVADGQLKISGDVYVDISGMYLAPGYKLKDFQCVTFGITSSPSDKTLSEIMKKEQRYLIWSIEHNAWWRPHKNGYTSKVSDAGSYSETEAFGIVFYANFALKENDRFIPDEALVPHND